MKRLLILLGILISGCSNAGPQQQSQQTEQPAVQTPVQHVDKKKYLASIQQIPPYRILTTDSVFVTPASLQKNKAVMIIYFSPDCSHCQRMMYELKPKMKEFKNIQVIMVTFSKDYDIRGIREFRRDYELNKYPNFVLGTEGYTMLVQHYYDVKTTPFIAIYNKNHKLSTYFDKVTSPDKIIAAVKKV